MLAQNGDTMLPDILTKNTAFKSLRKHITRKVKEQ